MFENGITTADRMPYFDGDFWQQGIEELVAGLKSEPVRSVVVESFDTDGLPVQVCCNY